MDWHHKNRQCQHDSGVDPSVNTDINFIASYVIQCISGADLGGVLWVLKHPLSPKGQKIMYKNITL